MRVETEGFTYLIVATTMVEEERAEHSWKGVGGGCKDRFRGQQCRV